MDVTRDGFLGRRLVIAQPARGAHRAGLDALLLAASLPDDTGGTILDLGAGVGVAGLAAAVRLSTATVTLAEIDPTAAALAGTTSPPMRLSSAIASPSSRRTFSRPLRNAPPAAFRRTPSTT